jgi:hypothetical protein
MREQAVSEGGRCCFLFRASPAFALMNNEDSGGVRFCVIRFEIEAD